MDDLPPRTRLPLSTRPGIIAGEAAEGDYSVVCDGVAVGRIHKGYPPPDGNAWTWSITCLLRPCRSDHSGRSASLEEAKRNWKDKWDEVNPDIEDERAAHANYVRRMARIGKPVESIA